MPTFPDHFARNAEHYAAYRPSYPAALFRWLAARAPSRRRAWDCGTGNGQAAQGLAEHFDEVIATDPVHAQLAHGAWHARVHFASMTAEAAALTGESFQLVTVAQALHWINRDSFYAEVRRVCVPGGVIAAWFYGLLTVDPLLDPLFRSFYSERVGKYWPAERARIDAGFSSIEFPFVAMDVPEFTMEVSWTLDQLSGYLGTWSAVARYTAAVGESPVPRFIDSVRPFWGGAGATRLVQWPLRVRAGIVGG